MGREGKGKRAACKNQTIPILYFPWCRTEEQLPLSPEDAPARRRAASSPSEPPWLWAPSAELSPSWGRGCRPRPSITLMWGPAEPNLLLQPHVSFISHSDFGPRLVLLGNCTFKEIILFIAGIHHTSVWKHQGSLLGHGDSTYGCQKRLCRDAGKNNLLKMTGSLLGPKWQHLNTQYARR